MAVDVKENGPALEIGVPQLLFATSIDYGWDVTSDGKRSTVAELGGGPNGAAIGPDGAAYVCNNGLAWTWQDGELNMPNGPPADYRGGSIQRVDLATGRFTTLYEHCDGKPLNAPNDLVFDRQGGFWFTCLGQSDGEVRRLGALYYARADGSKIIRWRSDLFSPNGVGLSPDERTVYMADCNVGRLYAFDLTAPGVMAESSGPPTAPGRVVCTLPGYQWLDSLAVEASGRICVGTLWNGRSNRTALMSTSPAPMRSRPTSALADPICAMRTSPARAPASFITAAGPVQDCGCPSTPEYAPTARLSLGNRRIAQSRPTWYCHRTVALQPVHLRSDNIGPRGARQTPRPHPAR